MYIVQIANVQYIFPRLKASMSVIRERTIDNEPDDETKVAAEVLVRKVPDNQQVRLRA